MKKEKFEQALERLEVLVETLETGNLPLEETLKVFEEGMKLASFCETKLNETQKKVEMLIKNQSGQTEVVDFDLATESE